MITALIVVGAVLAYLVIGWVVAIKSLPYAWAHAAEVHADSPYSSYAKWRRENVAGWTALRLLLWPIGLPAVLMAQMITRNNPEWIKQQVRERDKRIRDLERELGIGDKR